MKRAETQPTPPQKAHPATAENCAAAARAVFRRRAQALKWAARQTGALTRYTKHPALKPIDTRP